MVIARKELSWLPVILALSLKSDQVESRCLSSSNEESEQVYTPNIPDIYFTPENAATISIGGDVNLTKDNTTYILPTLKRPASAEHGCRSIAIAVQYCYSAAMEDIDNAVPVFAIIPNFEEELELVVKHPYHVTSTPRESVCGNSPNNNLLYCCDLTTLSDDQTAVVSNYGLEFGVLIRNYRLFAIEGSFSEYTTGSEHDSQEFLDYVTGENANMTLPLVRFLIDFPSSSSNNVWIKDLLITGSVAGAIVTVILLIPMVVLTVLVLFLLLERKRATKGTSTQTLLPTTHDKTHLSTLLTLSESPLQKELKEMKLKHNEAYATTLEASGDSPGLGSIFSTGSQQGKGGDVLLPSTVNAQGITACSTKPSSTSTSLPSPLHVELKLNECYNLETSVEDPGQHSIYDSLNIPWEEDSTVPPLSVGGHQQTDTDIPAPPSSPSPLLYAEITDDIDYDSLDETSEGEDIAPSPLPPLPAKDHLGRHPTRQLDIPLTSPSHMTKHHGDIKPSNKKLNLAESPESGITIIYDHLNEGENITALQSDAEECQYDYDYVIET